MIDQYLGQYLLKGHANEWYLDALKEIIKAGDEVTTRGRTTWEILHVVTRLPEPRKRVLTIPFRRANPFFQAMECVWILAGRADAAWITFYNSQLAQYLDPPIENRPPAFHGAYGERLVNWGESSRFAVLAVPGRRNQIQDVINQLKLDPNSRRAVMTIHNPLWDHPEIQTLDRPCNIAMSYQLRDGKLHAVTFNRSNDLNLGLAFTNICQFTTLQEFIAAALGAEVGEYVHFSSSLHVYKDDPVVQRLLNPMRMKKVEFDPVRLATTDAIHPGLILEGQADTEIVPPAAFDVYTYFSPRPMVLWVTDSYQDGWDYIHTLEGVGDMSLSLGYEEGIRMVEQIPCPYWKSIGHMALAWQALKGYTEPQVALRHALLHVGALQTPDWQVACLEFLHRWAQKRGQGEWFRAQFGITYADWPAPVCEFVLHDAGDQG